MLVIRSSARKSSSHLVLFAEQSITSFSTSPGVLSSGTAASPSQAWKLALKPCGCDRRATFAMVYRCSICICHVGPPTWGSQTWIKLNLLLQVVDDPVNIHCGRQVGKRPLLPFGPVRSDECAAWVYPDSSDATVRWVYICFECGGTAYWSSNWWRYL